MYPDYGRAFKTAFDVTKKFKIRTVPIDLDSVLDNLKNVKIQSYTEFCKNRKITIDEAVMVLESDLGAIAKHPTRDRYIIYYNDTCDNEGLKRFTLAHELGHYFLGHLLLVDRKLLRKGLSDEEYYGLEKEVNCFARNFLEPIPLADLVIDEYRTSSEAQDKLVNVFDVTYNAAYWRIKFSRWDRCYADESYINYYCGFSFTHDVRCSVCFNLQKHSNYCEICGSNLKTLGKPLSHRIKKEGAMLFIGKYVNTCPCCENEEIEPSDNYCAICGLDLRNYCENPECKMCIEGTPLKRSARHCPGCGEPSSFYEKGILSEWDDNSMTIQNIILKDDDLFQT